jgi:hypothetical protein
MQSAATYFPYYTSRDLNGFVNYGGTGCGTARMQKSSWWPLGKIGAATLPMFPLGERSGGQRTLIKGKYLLKHETREEL